MQLPAADLEAAREATRAAELETGGEIVAVVVEQCDRYDGALWAAAAGGSLLAAAMAAVARSSLEIWDAVGALWIAFPPLVGALVGYLLARVWPALRRALTAPRTLQLRAERRAAQALVDEQIMATRDRTGVLVFLALFERRAVVVGDRGLGSRVSPERWQEIADALAAGARAGRPGASLVSAIRSVGGLLAEAGVPRRPDDRNELDDEVRLHES